MIGGFNAWMGKQVRVTSINGDGYLEAQLVGVEDQWIQLRDEHGEDIMLSTAGIRSVRLVTERLAQAPRVRGA